MPWNPSTLTTGLSFSGQFTLTTPFTSTSSDLRFTVTNVYAPIDHGDTNMFLPEFSNIIVDDSVP